jgi:hypothetical protein
MPNTFKNSISGSIGNTETTIYTAPALTTTTVIGVAISNRIQSDISVDVKMYDSSASKNIFLCSGSLVPRTSNLVLVGGEQKLVLEQNDYLTLSSNIASSADIVVSVLEIS